MGQRPITFVALLAKPVLCWHNKHIFGRKKNKIVQIVRFLKNYDKENFTERNFIHDTKDW